MMILFLACLDPNGTVVGNPGTGSKYQARTRLAESNGFTYTEASLGLSSIEYYDEAGLVAQEEYNTIIDLIDNSNSFSLLGGSYTKLTFLFSETDPLLLSFEHEELGSKELEIPIQRLIFEQDTIEINSATIIQLGKKNWLRLENMQNTSILQGLLTHSSNIYSDENENGVLEEEETEAPLTEPEEEITYTLEGTWVTDQWNYGNDIVIEEVTINISPEGYLFQGARKINIQTNEVIQENIVNCGGIQPSEEITPDGVISLIDFSTDEIYRQSFYEFLTPDTLITNYIGGSTDNHNIVYRSSAHTPASFDLALPEQSDITALEFQNIIMGTATDPVYTTQGELRAKACLPDEFSAAISEDNNNAISISRDESSNSQAWIRIPNQQIQSIHVKSGSVHIAHDGFWEYLNLYNSGTRGVSYQGDAGNLLIRNSDIGAIYLSGTAQNLSLTSMRGSIYAYAFPSHYINAELLNDGNAEIHYRAPEDPNAPHGVYGAILGSGQLSIVSDPTMGSAFPLQIENEGEGTFVLACEEENPPEQCDSFN